MQEKRSQVTSGRPEAMLLLGPTGSGKSPLGDRLEADGLSARRCLHFDFGRELRSAARGEVAGLSESDIAFIRKCLAEGALLENDTFHIARAIFAGFLRHACAREADLLILNGLPRHAGQAADVESLAAVRLVVVLGCTADAVSARIAANTGGDRAGRTDDSPDAVRRKLALFADRTAPLVEHYRARGVPVLTLDIGAATTPQQAAAQLARQGAGLLPCH